MYVTIITITNTLLLVSSGLLISKYRVSPVHYRRYFFSIGEGIANTFKKSIGRGIAYTFLVKKLVLFTDTFFFII